MLGACTILNVNPNFEQELKASSTETAAAGCLLIHSPRAQGLCRRDEVYFRAGRKEL